MPIPFNDRSEMEVDLLFESERVVLELDGEQHLDDVAAYRRDRRKDYLLQLRGYVILRVLTEDVAKRLDALLDTLLAALTAHREDETR